MPKVQSRVKIKFSVPVELYLKFKRLCDAEMMPINDWFRKCIADVVIGAGSAEAQDPALEMQSPEEDMVIQGFKTEEQPEQDECCGKRKKKK